MKNVRVFFRKFGPCRYISHLDLNRVMIRAIGKSGLNIWRTEGFNQHAYITFALPLSLGFASECESMDFRVLDDEEDLAAVPAQLNACLPEGIRVFRCAEAVCKPADITSAVYQVALSPMNNNDISDIELSERWQTFLALPEMIVEKKTKKGMKNVDLKPYVLSCDAQEGMGVCFSLALPAGSALNINPSLMITAFSDWLGMEIYADITRTAILTKEGRDFA